MNDKPQQDFGTAPLSAAELVADERDVSSLYNFFLRRDPESPDVIREKVGRAISDIFAEMLSSAEFHQSILPAVISSASGSAIYRGTRDFAELLVWGHSRLPLDPALRARLLAARSWAECDEVLFTDPNLLEQFPRLRESGLDRIFELRKMGSKAGPVRDTQGAIDYANVWEVKGWCVDAENLNEKSTVDIFADNDLLGTAICRDYRRDIHEKLGGDGHFGFTFVIPAAAQETFGIERRLTIREQSSGVMIGNPLLIGGDVTRRIDSLDSVREQVLGAKNKIALLEWHLALLTADIGYPIVAYDEYARVFDQVTPELKDEYRRNLKRLSIHPRISIVLMFGSENLDCLDATLSSIQDQIFTEWELVIVGPQLRADERKERLSSLTDRVRGAQVRLLPGAPNAAILMREGLTQCGGDYVLFLRAGDKLTSDALYHNVMQIQRPGVKLVYADEDCYSLKGGQFHRHSPRLKPDLDLDYLLSDNYIGRFVLFERAALAEIGEPNLDISGAEEFDLVLRFIDAAGTAGIVHLPKVIYHQLETDRAPASADLTAGSANCRAANDYLARNGLAATAEAHSDPLGSACPSVLRLRWSVPDPAPKVSLIISTKDHPELIGPCLASLQATATHYRGQFETLVVDNGTTDPIAGALLRNLEANGRIRTISYRGSFNWSAMNNQAADQASGDVLIFLNNDTLAITEDWLDELVGQAMRPKVGAVGVRLLFADGTVQHAGIVLGVRGSSSHEGVGEPVANGGYLGRSRLQRQASAVTGACLATRKDVFVRMKGFDEIAFKIMCSDVDYCLRLTAAGFAVVYTPFATFHHFEAKSRGPGAADGLAAIIDAELMQFRTKWAHALPNDPLYNPHFSRTARPFATLIPSKRR